MTKKTVNARERGSNVSERHKVLPKYHFQLVLTKLFQTQEELCL